MCVVGLFTVCLSVWGGVPDHYSAEVIHTVKSELTGELHLQHIVHAH